MAIEHGIRSRELMIKALSRELLIQTSTHDEKVPYWSAAELLLEYKALSESGQLDSPLDSTESISDDRHLLATAIHFGITGVDVVHTFPN